MEKLIHDDGVKLENNDQCGETVPNDSELLVNDIPENMVELSCKTDDDSELNNLTAKELGLLEPNRKETF